MHHLAKKHLGLIILVISTVVGVFLFFGFLSAQASENLLALSVANTIVQDQSHLAQQGYESPEGAIVVRVQPKASGLNESSLKDTVSISIWKYENRILKPATVTDFEQAKKNGNVFVFMFMLQKIDGNKAFVDVATFYSGGGGNSSHRLFEYSSQNWQENNVDVYYYWD